MRRAKIARYTAVGLLTFGVYVAAGQAARQLQLSLAMVGTLPFTLAVITNYLLQRHWVFEDCRPISASLPKYVVMIGLGYAINVAVLTWAPLAAPLFVVQTVAATVVVLSNAVLAFFWVYFDSGRRVERHGESEPRIEKRL